MEYEKPECRQGAAQTEGTVGSEGRGWGNNYVPMMANDSENLERVRER